ncbi:MAG: class I SAM-dependent methyltransferase [Spirochaetaceae bacterium]|jgi:SAM-dependent methyltransferase|nr:class I SAM-dependent methyltransferase [Spirochaetaceae bacterium]
MDGLEFKTEVIKIMQYLNLENDSKFRKIQEIQTNHRLKLIRKWGIKSGQKILEIGCGQGDMTAALAYTVGNNGKIMAIDIAPREYGAPFTIGESMDRLKETELGKVIEPHFSHNLLTDISILENKIFDGVVFAHCSWYFHSIEEFTKILKTVKPFAKKIFFAEWDLCIRLPEQTGHFIAAMVQGEYSAFQQTEKTNIKTLVSKQDISTIVKSLHLTVKEEGSFDSGDMQDGEWEINSARELITEKNIEKTGLSKKTKDILLTQIKLIGKTTKPLDTYWSIIV